MLLFLSGINLPGFVVFINQNVESPSFKFAHFLIYRQSGGPIGDTPMPAYTTSFFFFFAPGRTAFYVISACLKVMCSRIFSLEQRPILTSWSRRLLAPQIFSCVDTCSETIPMLGNLEDRVKLSRPTPPRADFDGQSFSTTENAKKKRRKRSNSNNSNNCSSIPPAGPMTLFSFCALPALEPQLGRVDVFSSGLFTFSGTAGSRWVL